MAPGARFAFGENWSRFLGDVDEERVARAERSLAGLLGAGGLAGRRFLDVGSGSGLFSLAARRLGATVRSFDYDPDSVAATAALRERFRPGDPDWAVERGSVLDEEWLAGLGAFDVVYAWGVLHHTGSLWRAVELAAGRVAPGGSLVLALYNDQGLASRLWRAVKLAYGALPRGLRWLVLWPAAARLWGPTLLRDAARLDPRRTWRARTRERGMSPWRDVVDWVGGYPFEVARPEAVTGFLAGLGFRAERFAGVGRGHGCNEFVFRRGPAPTDGT